VTLGTATIGALANWSTSVPLALTTGDTTTFQAADANSLAHNITLNGAISGGGNIATIGAGEEVLSALNNYTGSTSVMAGTLEVSGSLSATSSVSVQSGTLELAANNALAQTAPIMLNAGVLQVLASQSEALGTLTLNGGASTLSLGASGDVINFADSSALAWTGTLTISDWTGLSAGGGSDEVFIGTTNDLTAAQLADITFTNGTLNGVSFGSDSAVQLADGELVAAAIPEPGTWAMMLAGAGMLCVWRRSCGARGAERTV
jgi:autotransporter-associated beta strand protein